MRRPNPLLIAALVLLPALGSCRRRVSGACADHVDCDPGFDCIDHRCTRRAALQGEGVTPPAAGPDAEASEPTRPPSPEGEDPAITPTASPPAKKATPPTKSAPGNPPGLQPAPAPAPGQREPLWKLRRKNS